jgi:katanin p80 WD40 repeat-containing subunit B1
LSSPDCDLYAASDENKLIYIWKRGRENPLITLSGNTSLVTTLNLNTADAELYTGLKGGSVIIWDLESSKVKYNLQGHSTEITAISLAKCEDIPTYLVSAALDGKIKFWDLRARGTPLNLKGHLSAVKSLAISPDCKLIASGADDGIVRLWDIRANKILKEFSIEDQGNINCIEFNPYNITLAYGANDKTIKHWDLERNSLVSVTPFDRLPITKLKFDCTGKNIFSCTNESIKYWMVDDDDPKLLNIIEAGWNKLQDLQYIEEDAIYAVNTYANKLGYWRIPFDKILSTSENVKRSKSDVISEFNHLNNAKIVNQTNNLQPQPKMVISGLNIYKQPNSNFNKDIYFNDGSFNTNTNNQQPDSVFMRNGNIKI